MNVNSQNSNYLYPWQYDNHFRLLVDGPVFFPAMLDAILQAKHYILLEMYLIQSGNVTQKFIHAIRDAADRGVAVFILLDDFGARELGPADRNMLSHNHIFLHYYNPLHLKKHTLLLFRDHRKILIIDGTKAYIGGTGLTDEFDSTEHPELNWRENMLEIRGPNVNQWQNLFTRNWSHWSDVVIPFREPESHQGSHKGRVAMTEGPNLLEIKRSAINRIRNAKQQVWFCTAYFVPSRKIRHALRNTARRGVDVRLLIPGPITDHPMTRHLAQYHYSKLLKDKVRIFEYQPRFLHAKIIVCDNWVSTGSCNIDRWNLRWNLDANQEIEDFDFTESVKEIFNQDFSHCKEILYNDWHKRSLFNRLTTWCWVMYIRLADISLTRLRIIRHWKKFRNKRG
ncbi:MAG: phosphatidylserine/phosphatidylglycerophosphate/cardiolipin synthase family protein [Gammaproteobacteria bacterium]|nr:phosphatidylserine/phosphatidylglycerophosphate/cardiolipin synthase family protein [Gammaproteobacteria bacterium]MDH5734536.1 phosphatidylserine/phosphatidylglycerophosphate/cardiolipin synthase family protein [Gammaproteobacteria bacterium]